MNNIIGDVLSILDYIVFRQENDIYKKYTNKQYNYGIEYISSIDITIIPRTIYIFTDNIKNDYEDKVLKFYIDLLYKVHQCINKSKIPVLENTNVGLIKSIGRDKKISIIRGATLYPLKGTDFEIWIYIDELPKNEERQSSSCDFNSNVLPYRIIICRSTELSTRPNEDLSIIIRLDN